MSSINFLSIAILIIFLSSCGGSIGANTSSTTSSTSEQEQPSNSGQKTKSSYHPYVTDACDNDPETEICRSYFQDEANFNPEACSIDLVSEECRIFYKICSNAYKDICSLPGRSIINPILVKNIKTPIDNYLISSSDHSEGINLASSGKGLAISDVTYGTIKDILGEVRYNRDVVNHFIAVKSDDIGENSKNNIIKINSGQESRTIWDNFTEATLSEIRKSDKYYYSHFRGDPFIQFLPSVNKLEILALKTSYGSKIDTVDSNIFCSCENRDIFSGMSEERKERFNLLLFYARNRTYEGFALARYLDQEPAVGKELPEAIYYPGRFTLEMNSSGDRSGEIRPDDDHFSISFIFNISNLRAEVGPSGRVNSKDFIPREISFDNYNLLFSNNGSFREREELSDDVTLQAKDNNMFAFAVANKKVFQIAGTFNFEKLIPPRGGIASEHTKFLRVMFVSNKCYTDDSDNASLDCKYKK